MLGKLFLLSAFFMISFVFSFSATRALDCSICAPGACFCNITECSTGTLDVYNTNCTGIPSKEFIFSNGNFTWLKAQAQNYYFLVSCDSGTKLNCTQVNLTYNTIATTTTISTTTTSQLLPCPYPCCIGEPGYLNSDCQDIGSICEIHQCVPTTTTTTTTPSPSINYSLIGIVLIAVVIGVFVLFIFLRRKPKDNWSELYKKYGRRQ